MGDYTFQRLTLSRCKALITKIDGSYLPSLAKKQALERLKTRINKSTLTTPEKNSALQAIIDLNEGTVVPIDDYSDDDDVNGNYKYSIHSKETRFSNGNFSATADSDHKDDQSTCTTSTYQPSGDPKEELRKIIVSNSHPKAICSKIIQMKATPKDVIERIITECYSYHQETYVELLKELTKKEAITEQQIRDELFDHLEGGCKEMYQLLHVLNKAKLVTYKQILQDTLEKSKGDFLYTRLEFLHREEISLKRIIQTIAYDYLDENGVLVLQNIAKHRYFKQFITEATPRLVEKLKEKETNDRDTYALLKALHAIKAKTINDILDYIGNNEDLELSKKHAMYQHIFKQSAYYKPFLKEVPEDLQEWLMSMPPMHNNSNQQVKKSKSKKILHRLARTSRKVVQVSTSVFSSTSKRDEHNPQQKTDGSL